IAGDNERFYEIVLGRVDIAACKLFLVGVGNAMNDKVDSPPQLACFCERRIDRTALGDVAVAEHVRSQFLCEGSDALLQRLALKRERQFGPCRVDSLGYAPCDRPVVRHSEDDASHPTHDACVDVDQSGSLHQGLAHDLYWKASMTPFRRWE